MNDEQMSLDLGEPVTVARWVMRVDIETEMLECTACKNRVIGKYYRWAVGNHGFRYCPYCGVKMEGAE